MHILLKIAVFYIIRKLINAINFCNEETMEEKYKAFAYIITIIFI